MVKEKWIPIIAVACLGMIGFLYYEDKKNNNATGTSLAGSALTLETPQPIANSSVGSYIDPTGGLDYVDAVPVSQTSPTGFTAADYNYGTVNEQPIAQLGNGYDLVAATSGGYGIVPTGPASLQAYNQVVG